MYAQNAILVNEFTGHSWSKVSNTSIIALRSLLAFGKKTTHNDMMILQKINGTKLGVLVMESRGFFPESYWYWIGLGACIGFMFLFNFGHLICLTYLGGKFFLLCFPDITLQQLKYGHKILQHMTRNKLYYQKKMKRVPSELGLRLRLVEPHPQK